MRTQRNLADGAGLTHREIGERLGISFARVQQIERRALAKLRRLAKRHRVELPECFR